MEIVLFGTMQRAELSQPTSECPSIAPLFPGGDERRYGSEHFLIGGKSQGGTLGDNCRSKTYIS